jgi:hypothetical protein
VSTSGFLVLILVGIAAIFFITEWLRADLVALLLLVALGAVGILTPQETLSGFSRSAVITILAIFILTAGLAKTGATRALGARLMQWSGRSESSLIAVLMAASAFLSLFMNNIAAASVLLPVAVGASRERKVSPSKLMMPLAFGSILDLAHHREYSRECGAAGRRIRGVWSVRLCANRHPDNAGGYRVHGLDWPSTFTAPRAGRLGADDGDRPRRLGRCLQLGRTVVSSTSIGRFGYCRQYPD